MGRSGQLDGVLWGVSRMGGQFNWGTPGGVPRANLDFCGTNKYVKANEEIQICNGRMVEATNDNPELKWDAGGVTALTMYPKQPFDFAGRVGTVAFDVTNDSAGTHAAWPEFWLTDMPVPNPFAHFGSLQSLPQNGLAIRFAATVSPGQYGMCPNGNNLDKWRWGVDSAAVMRDWKMEDIGAGHEGDGPGGPLNPDAQSAYQTGMIVTMLDCVIAPDYTQGANAAMNHIEIKIAQNRIDVYATDAGKTSPLKHIAKIENANLTFTRGFIWIEDVHYNADKATTEDPGARPSQRDHTFAWDNIAFDGPILARDFSYDVLDSMVVADQPWLPNTDYIGWQQFPAPETLTILNSVPIPNQATINAATNTFLLFNFWQTEATTTFEYYINGTRNTYPWPYPDKQTYTNRTIAVPIPKSQLKPGANTVAIRSDKGLIYYNVSINLAGAAGIVNP